MTSSEWIRTRLPDGVLETQIRGTGDPVVLIQTAVTSDEFLPLSVQPALADNYQIVLYHRRGYGGSSPAHKTGTMERDAMDCQRLLEALGIHRAHLVGVSYSAAVGLQLAAMAPEMIRSLCIIEPPPVHTSASTEFLTACGRLIEDYRRRGPVIAIDDFLTRPMGPAWRTDLEQHRAGHATDVERDAGTFFTADLPALLGWHFSAEVVQRVIQPVLYVGEAAAARGSPKYTGSCCTGCPKSKTWCWPERIIHSRSRMPHRLRLPWLTSSAATLSSHSPRAGWLRPCRAPPPAPRIWFAAQSGGSARRNRKLPGSGL